MKKKLFVNSQLQVTESKSDCYGIVNIVNYNMEILILKPIAHDADMNQSWYKVGEFKLKKKRSRYTYRLPSLSTCYLANRDEHPIPVCSCYTGTDITDHHGRIDGWYALNDEAKSVVGRKVMKNVYAAIVMTKKEFLDINPGIDLRQYLFLSD